MAESARPGAQQDKIAKEIGPASPQDPELASRIHHYSAQGDDTPLHPYVTGLDACGEMVFQHLWTELEEASATQRGAQVDSMLRRFVGELAAALNTANPLADDDAADEVENSFLSLLNATTG